MKNITIVGMGALGILFGELLTRTLGMEAVTFLADEKRIASYKSQGIYCNGKKCEFKMESIAQPADLLIFAVKGTALTQAMELARGAVGENTVIISLLNGISSEEILGESLGKEHLIYCIAQGMDAVKLENKLTYVNAGELILGIPKEEANKLTQLNRLAGLLERAQVPYRIDEDIMHRLWCKWMMNVGVNQTVMVEEGTYGTIQKPGKARETAHAAMEEVKVLSECAGTGITKKDMDAYLALTDSLNPDGMPSMRQDGLAHRNSEVEFFAGTVIKLGQKYGVEVPVNRVLYQKIKDIEARY